MQKYVFVDLVYLFLFVFPCILPRKILRDSSEVKAVHISLGNQTNEICIIWGSSLLVDYPGQNKLPCIRYGLTKQLMNQTAIGRTIPFNAGKITQFHRVVISNLYYGRNYFYQIIKFSNNTNPEPNPVFTFKTPPSSASKSPTNFLVFADLGTLSNSIPYLIQESLNYEYSSVFHVGDIAYDLGGEQGAVGERFISSLQNMVSRLPYITVPGDHEFFDSYEYYRHWFSMPKQDWPMAAKYLWYSLDIGVIHFIILVTEDFITESSNMQEQLKWLEKDLKEANINRYYVPWIVVLAHRPLYCSVQNLSEDCAKEDSKVRKNLEDIIFTGGVDLVISGHEHNYERTYPVYKKRVLAYNYKNAPGPVHLIVGTCGYPYIVDRIKSQPEYWSAFSESDRSKEMFGRLHVYNKSHIYWEMLRADNNQRIDRIWLIKERHGPFTLTRIFPPKHVIASRNMNIEELQRYLQDDHLKTTINYVYFFCLLSALILIYLLKNRRCYFYKNLTKQIIYIILNFYSLNLKF